MPQKYAHKQGEELLSNQKRTDDVDFVGVQHMLLFSGSNLLEGVGENTSVDNQQVDLLPSLLHGLSSFSDALLISHVQAHERPRGSILQQVIEHRSCLLNISTCSKHKVSLSNELTDQLQPNASRCSNDQHHPTHSLVLENDLTPVIREQFL